MNPNPGAGGVASPEVSVAIHDLAASPITRWVTIWNRAQQLQRIVNAEFSLLDRDANCRFQDESIKHAEHAAGVNPKIENRHSDCRAGAVPGANRNAPAQ
ncbi:MAG: hypothetical protein FWD68_04695 [Alphaproteobacteria bacterium]|nr:hypothetical protein [Alphaproteobacteria bacterium]